MCQTADEILAMQVNFLGGVPPYFPGSRPAPIAHTDVALLSRKSTFPAANNTASKTIYNHTTQQHIGSVVMGLSIYRYINWQAIREKHSKRAE